MMGTWVIPSFLEIQNSWKYYSENQKPVPIISTHFLYIPVIQNKGYYKAKQKLSQIPLFTKVLKGLSIIQWCRLLVIKERWW